MSSNRRTARAVRRDAGLPAPPQQPYESRYQRPQLYPATLAELRKMCGDLGEAAVTDLQWSLVLLWLMDSHELPLSNPWQVTVVAVQHCQAVDRARLGYPHWNSGTFAVHDLSPESRREARLVAEEALADWRNAECKYLSRAAIKRTYSYIQSCLRNAAEATPQEIKENAACPL